MDSYIYCRTLQKIIERFGYTMVDMNTLQYNVENESVTELSVTALTKKGKMTGMLVTLDHTLQMMTLELGTNVISVEVEEFNKVSGTVNIEKMYMEEVIAEIVTKAGSEEYAYSILPTVLGPHGVILN